MTSGHATGTATSAVPSLWNDTLSDSLRCPTDPLDGTIACDVAIVGAGLTGLWSAHYLARRQPSLSIVVIDAHGVGFGASGRNGGWASALLPMSLDRMAREHGRDRAVAMQRAMIATLDFVARSDYATILPATICTADLGGAERWLHPIVDPALSVNYALISPATRAMSPAARAFLDRLRIAHAESDARWTRIFAEGPAGRRSQPKN